jgi:hypothetical protein
VPRGGAEDRQRDTGLAIALVQRLVRGDAPAAAGPYADAFGPYVNKDLKPYPYDVGRAKALLDEAGFKPGADGVLQKDGKRRPSASWWTKGIPSGSRSRSTRSSRGSSSAPT